jgi:hypothetical protein
MGHESRQEVTEDSNHVTIGPDDVYVVDGDKKRSLGRYELLANWAAAELAHEKTREEVARLKQLHHDIYEVYAGSEGLPCQTASEGYLCGLISKMAELAAEGKS